MRRELDWTTLRGLIQGVGEAKAHTEPGGSKQEGGDQPEQTTGDHRPTEHK